MGHNSDLRVAGGLCLRKLKVRITRIDIGTLLRGICPLSWRPGWRVTVSSSYWHSTQM